MEPVCSDYNDSDDKKKRKKMCAKKYPARCLEVFQKVNPVRVPTVAEKCGHNEMNILGDFKYFPTRIRVLLVEARAIRSDSEWA
ncbi:hypothetical protein AVEN_85620-1 [Araneus ventricosus]|uniref:Uncharacterized protein n=1 Tax=Araneus ventricosus TaxID=182803 RepID=A0A4Y2NNB5_ARAVE|nr:hypothetical protein AVEN_85620-1 [Araneus ventricosus]